MIIYHLLKIHLSKMTCTSFSSTKVASIVVQSALLYTISHLSTVGLLVHISPTFNFPRGILAQMAVIIRHFGISPTLLILRVHIGRYSVAARESTAIKLSELEFAVGGTMSGRGSVAEEDEARLVVG
ncbi:hypothetical protein CPC08DRAFT_711588 [Agrocybe pediades]|nr:hypothetical protein CPC08DRAFT_711588 [Agrocybe pediades]